MNALVVYDSAFGNTERLARAIATVLGTGAPAAVVKSSVARAGELAGIDLLVVGGPTQGHGLSPALKEFLESVPAAAVRDLPAAAFDTRMPWPRFLSGSAAAAIAKQLETKGTRLVVPPESFLVRGSEGPLTEGELERATTWAHAVRVAVDHRASEPAGAAPE